MIALLPSLGSGRWINWVGSIQRAKEHQELEELLKVREAVIADLGARIRRLATIEKA